MNINRNFPNNAMTTARIITGADTVEVLASGTFTILGVDIKQSGQGHTLLRCGSDQISKNYGGDYDFMPINYVCLNKPLIIEKTGVGDESITQITYVNYDMTQEQDLDFNVPDLSGFWLFFGFILFFYIFFSLINYFKVWIRQS